MRNWSMSKEQVSIQGSWNDVLHHRLYFGTSGAGSSVITAGEYYLFSNGVGQQERNISTSGLVTLTDAESSMRGKNGTIPKGESFVIVAIGMNITVSSVQATTPFEDDSVTSINVTPITRANPIPLVQTIQQQSTFELWKNSNELLERGNFDEYPTEFGFMGFSGGNGATSETSTDITLIGQNNAKFRTLTVYQVLTELDQFYGVFKVNREIDLDDTKLSGCIDFYLVGKAMTKYEAPQYVANFVG